MQFSCGSCSTRYSVPDERVRGKRVRTQCRKCGAEIVVEGAPGPATSAAPEASSPARLPSERPSGQGRPTPHPAPLSPSAVRGEEPWTVAPDRSARRKMNTQELVDAYAAGGLDESALVWKQGMAAWQHPSEVPAIALALKARGVPVRPRETKAPQPETKAPQPETKAPQPETKAPPPAVGASASSADASLNASWDDENEATRVLESGAAGALLSLAESSPTRPPPRPSLVPRKPTLAPKKPSIPPKKPPATRSAAAASASGPKAVAVSPPPVKLESPSSPSAFTFDDEATAVIAPDRARELLEAEAKRSGAPATPAPAAPENETPLGFGFDDEATQVLEAGRAHALLNAPSLPPPAGDRATPAAFPAPPSDADRGKEDEPTALPTVMVSKTSPKTLAAEPPPQKPKAPPPAVRELLALSNEPTRVVRLKKRGPAPGLWLLIVFALIAAAAGGFIASELLPRGLKSPGADAP